MAARLIVWFVTASVVIGLSGCGRSGQAEPPTNEGPTVQDQKLLISVGVEDYFPADIGMEWVYAGSGNEFASFSSRVTHRDGQRAQILVSSGAVLATVYDIESGRVVKRVQRAGVEPNESLLDAPAETAEVILKGPLRKGNTWSPFGKNSGSQSAQEGTERSVEAVDMDLTTPAGHFRHVVKVRISRQGSEDVFEYYALGVGLVKREFAGKEPIVSTLREFRRGAGRR